MKTALFVAALLATTPALAVTANSGAVNAGTNVQVGSVSDPDGLSEASPGLPAPLSVSASSSVEDANAQSTVSAYVNSAASWSSADAGTVTLSWGWSALNDGSGNPTVVNTNQNLPNWSYSFTTGAQAAKFNASWVLLASAEVATTEGIQGIYGIGALPQFVTPGTIAPSNGSGSFSVLLAPNTSYMVGIFNYGNLFDFGDGLSSVADASFTMNWSIGAVPEPSSWAMMIAGFGLIGASARRRRGAPLSYTGAIG